MLLMAALILGVFLAATSHALILNVVDSGGNPIPSGTAGWWRKT